MVIYRKYIDEYVNNKKLHRKRFKGVLLSSRRIYLGVFQEYCLLKIIKVRGLLSF